MTPVLFVGLGNPGPEYDQTRHNIGYMALDHLAKSWGISFKEAMDLATIKAIESISSNRPPT